MNVAQAIADLGINQPDGLDLVIVRLNPRNARFEHYRFDDYRNHEMNGGTYYLASGGFVPGSVSKYEGRTGKNVGRLLWLPFDFDLTTYMHCDTAWLWSLDDTALWGLIDGLRADIEEVFGVIGLPIHRLDYTGYGLAAYVYLPPHKQSAVAALQALHKGIVERINTVARMPLADPQVSDAGTRIMRLVPSLNTKSDIPRQTKTIYLRLEPVVTVPMLKAAAAMTPPPERMIPKGKRLSDDVATLIVDHVSEHWSEGRRHQLALGLAGMLAKAGVPEEQTTAIIERMPDDDWQDREKAVATTYERVRSGLDVRGFYALRDALPAALVEWIDGELGKLRATGPTLIVGGQRAEPAETPKDTGRRKEFGDLPASALTGWIGEYCRLMEPTTESPIAYHFGVGVTTIGAMVGRRIASQYGTDALYPNLYTLLVGRSGRTRKDTAIKRITRTLFDVSPSGTKIINHGVGIATDVGSSTKLIDMLRNKPNTLLYITEFTRLMGNARRQATDTIIPTLIEAFDTPTVMQNNSMANPIEALYPFLSILAATQPDLLSEAMTGADMNSGFANRWLYVCGNLGAPIPLAPRLDLSSVSMLMHDLWEAKNSYAEGTALSMTPEAVERWSAWYIADYHRESPNPEEDAMRARHAVLIQKLALIYAIVDRRLSIDLDHLNIAIEVIEWMWAQMHVLTPSWGRTIDGQIEERIKAVITRGPIKKRDLQRQASSRKWSGVEFSRVFDAMVKNGAIKIDPTRTVMLDDD